ncbi:unnamed protein product [Lymnaea stagnalis]|uniref:Uncharacterized protein n=1 Tax=Lymnaea stagnalis TaxID=6523 RepID=A0AAV2IMT6_LYMST
MGKLVLVNGFDSKNYANTTALIEFLTNHTDGEKILHCWRDPYQEKRIVAIFEKDMEPKKIQQLQRDGLHNQIAVDMVAPTDRIFVRTIGETWMHGHLDKLNMIFAKSMEKNQKITNLPGSCFEIIFKDGWDSVLNVCQESRRFERHPIMIYPYFDCFKESPQEQYHEILCRLKKSMSTETNYQVAMKNNIFTSALHIVPLLLDCLEFKEAVELSEKGLKVHIDVEEAKITIQGPEDRCRNINKVLSDVNKKLKLSDNTKDFLENEAIQQEILTFIKSSGLKIFLEKNGDKFSLHVVGNKKKELFQTFVSSLVVVKKCHLLPDENFQGMPAWNEFIGAIHSTHVCHQVFTEGTTIELLALSFCNVSETKSIESSIKEFISKVSDLKTLPKMNETSSTQENKPVTQLCQAPGCPMSSESFLMPINFNKKQYCKQFLQDEFSKMQKQNAETQINIRSNDIQIICNSYQVLEDVSRQLESLVQRITFVDKELEFPGLNLFFQSEDGKKLILEISQKYKCFIDYPFLKGEIDNSQLQVERKIERFNYKVCVLGTGRQNNCNIHLVQGNIEDMKLHQSFGTKVQFIPSIEAQECSLKIMETGGDIRIHLPPWKSSDMASFTHFRKLRQTFLSSIDDLFQQIKNKEGCTVVISTSRLHQAEFPFPLDVIANGVTQSFKQFAHLNTNPKTVDLYICETKHESVFKAFTFALKNQGIFVGAPGQTSWEKISFPDTFNCFQYAALKCKVEVASISPETPTMKSLYCYPIHPSLEASSCQFYYESKRSKYLLEDSLRKLPSRFPEGLLMGETCFIERISNNKHGLIFCFPEWGTDIHKALQDSLSKCLLDSSEYDAVYITVPESQHPKFPKQYFVQTFFQTMDEIVSKLKVFRQKKIVLVVHDEEYREAFHKELERRYKTDTKNVDKLHKLSSTAQEASMTDPQMLTSAVLASPITYWGKSKDDLIQAHDSLTRELSRLMSEFTTSRRLTKKGTLMFEKSISNMQELPVVFKLQKQTNEQRQITEKGMCRNKTDSCLDDRTDPVSLESSLTVKGLSENIVNDFMLNFTGCYVNEDLLRTDSGQKPPEDQKRNAETLHSKSKNFRSKKRAT